MSMTLTRYQGNTLAAVKAYFERCAFESPEAAYKTVTEEGDVRLRLGADYGYKSPKGMEDVPTVCIKVPTNQKRGLSPDCPMQNPMAINLAQWQWYAKVSFSQLRWVLFTKEAERLELVQEAIDSDWQHINDELEKWWRFVDA